jgi:hypothetical protein
MMNAAIVLNHHGMHSEVPTEARTDTLAAERLTERFADLTWKTIAPVTALSLTFAVGVLTCAQLFVHI